MRQSTFSNGNVLGLLAISGLGIIAGITAGASISVEPTLVAAWVLLCGAIFGLIYLITNFEFALVSLLVVRSAMDAFPPLSSVFALGFLALAFIYVIWLLLRRQPIQTNMLCWAFCGWAAFQGLWIVLLPLGGLGDSGTSLFIGLSEWLRTIVWVSVYVVFLQLKGRFPPEKAISMLFLSLVIPLSVGLLQLIVPDMLPSNLAPIFGVRVRGTIGHSATFSSFTLLFIGLTWWKYRQAIRKLPWLILMGTLVFFLVKAQSITITLSMLPVMFLVIVAPRLSLQNLLGVVTVFGLFLGLILSTDIGQERLASLADTPLLNPDIDWSRSFLLSQRDGNSFNWRIAQWTLLLEAWKESPLLGYGLDTSPELTVWQNFAHNDYVRALAEQGIVGLLSFLGLLLTKGIYLVKTFISSPKGSPKRDLCFILFAFYVASLVGMAAENLWTHTALYTYWWALVAIMSWDWQSGAPKQLSGEMLANTVFEEELDEVVGDSRDHDG